MYFLIIGLGQTTIYLPSLLDHLMSGIPRAQNSEDPVTAGTGVFASDSYCTVNTTVCEICRNAALPLQAEGGNFNYAGKFVGF